MSDSAGLSIGEWSWDAGEQRLHIEADEAAGFDEISGSWTLGSISHVLDGLSRSRLKRLLAGEATGAGEISCLLGLSTGKAVKLVGTFEGQGSASGVLTRDFRVTGEVRSQPGPELEAVFQPILSLGDGKIAGFEALARWQGQAPGDHGGQKGIGDAGLAPNMLMRASEALVQWREGSGQDDLFVNVNLTGRDIVRPDLADLVTALVSGHGFAAGQLRIELTEQAALRDAGAAIEAARKLKQAGAGVILDDFGSGHSSFSWLAALPADGLKVDAELIAQLSSARVQTILRSVTSLARALEMSATAEGVEDLAMIATLRQLGFDHAQGFAFSRPVDADQACELLKA